MQVFNTEGRPVKAWIDGVEIEEEAILQAKHLAEMPFAFKHVALMPDAHAGLGATVGTVFAADGAVIPAAVGVDIGCGMLACRTTLTREELVSLGLPRLRDAIEAAVPHGRTENGGPGDKGAWQVAAPTVVMSRWVVNLSGEYDRLLADNPGLLGRGAFPWQHLGTLGGGNHFIELSIDEECRVWIVIHSGSRGVGNRIGTYFTALAKEACSKWFVNLPDPNLAFLPAGTPEFDRYLDAVEWAQRFAKLNRELMLASVLSVLPRSVSEDLVFDCHHNYVAREHHFGRNVLVTRKGAVRAREGDMGIIPGSMGAKSYIVRGKGNPDSFHSCAHGAGRRMSRTEAKRRFTVEDHARATAGVVCRKDLGVVDETPGAYKDIDAVMAAQTDLVEVVHVLKQTICVKG